MLMSSVTIIANHRYKEPKYDLEKVSKFVFVDYVESMKEVVLIFYHKIIVFSRSPSECASSSYVSNNLNSGVN